MRRLILAMSVSFDGFAAKPDGTLDWFTRPGGQLLGDRRQRGYHELAGQVGTIVLGRRAYEEMRPAWQGSDSTMARFMNELPKVVFTTTLDGPLEWDNATVARDALEDEVAALKEEPGKDIVCFGGAEFARALAAAKLIDEYRLTVHPVALGAGLPLLHGLPEPQPLDLVSATTYTDGSIVCEYTPRAS